MVRNPPKPRFHLDDPVNGGDVCRWAEIAKKITQSEDPYGPFYLPDWNDADIIDAIFNREGAFRYNSSYYLKLRNLILKHWREEKEEFFRKLNKLNPKSESNAGFYSKWITLDALIAENLNRKKNRHFLPIGKILQDQRIKPSNLDICDCIGNIHLPFCYGESKTSVLVIVPYDEIQRELKISKEEVDKNLRAMQHCGIIQKYKRDGVRGPWIYAIGTWLEVRTKKGSWRRSLFFLKECPERIQMLRSVDVYKFD
jgi:hypothetical protein